MDVKSYNFSNDSEKILETVSLGDRFREAREAMGLSQQKVADCLCLKLSIIKSIEEGYVHTLEIASTFLYGYIRSYARLVDIDNEDIILSFIRGFDPIIAMRMKPTHNVVTLYKKYGKMIKALVIIVFISVIFIVLMLVIRYSKYVFLKEEYSNIFSIISKHPIIYEKNRGDLLFSSGRNLLDRNFGISFSSGLNFINSIRYPSYFVFNLPDICNGVLCDTRKYSLYKSTVYHIDDNDIGWMHDISYIDNDMLVLSFTSDCWVKILDANDKVLYIGTQYSGDVLSLKGVVPYRLTIGAPQSVNIRYRGDIIDLNRFIHPHKVTRLIIPLQ